VPSPSFIIAGVTAFLVTAQAPAAGGRALDLRVIVQGTGLSDVIVRAFIEPDPHNRAVEFVVDADQYYGSSVKVLDTDRAPRTNEVKFLQLPSGEYEVRVTLLGDTGVRDRAVWHGQLW
jgi:hypothetical protein